MAHQLHNTCILLTRHFFRNYVNPTSQYVAMFHYYQYIVFAKIQPFDNFMSMAFHINWSIHHQLQNY